MSDGCVTPTLDVGNAVVGSFGDGDVAIFNDFLFDVSVDSPNRACGTGTGKCTDCGFV